MKNAGYTIIDHVWYELDGNINRYIVLGERRTQYGYEYVTWESADHKDFFWGHYFTHYEFAKADFYNRLKEKFEYKGEIKRRKEYAR